jgi:hypothetical protein
MTKAEPVAKKGGQPGNQNAASEEKRLLPGNNRFEERQQPTRGNSSEYLAGRIKAKAATDPVAGEVAAAVERGEYKSMRAAARDAGVIRAKDPVKAALKAIAKVPEDRLDEHGG